MKIQSFMAAASGGALAAIAADLADPRDFNFHTGWGHLLEVAIGGAAAGLAAWFAIKRSAKNPGKGQRRPPKAGSRH